MNEPLIWWTNQEDAERVEVLSRANLLDDWPDYLRDQFASRMGRAGRGRLWSDERFGTTPAQPWNNANPLCRIANDAGGIVIEGGDLKHVADLPGFVTTLAMHRPSPAGEGVTG